MAELMSRLINQLMDIYIRLTLFEKKADLNQAETQQLRGILNEIANILTIAQNWDLYGKGDSRTGD